MALRLANGQEEWSSARLEEAPALAAALALPRAALERALALRGEAEAIAEREERRAAAKGARLLARADPDYPAPLADLEFPPPVLFCRGSIPAGAAVAIVGSRRADAYALEVAGWLGRECATAGLVVVSGFARGVDAAAHRGALAVAGGRTVALLGCGLDVAYPRGHAALGDEIAAAGAVASEFALGVPPEGWRFPVRNRLIAAWAAATVVVAAAPRSGSLVTARLALELGRDVFAVPGRLFDELALGSNGLIADGATPLLHPDDLLCALGLARRGGAAPLRSPREATESAGDPLLAALAGGAARDVDQLAEATALAVDDLFARLLELELSGRVTRLPGPRFKLRE